MRLGFHISIGGGFRKTVREAVQYRCSALQVFTSAPVQWKRTPIDPNAAAWFAEELRRLDIQPLFVHAIYLLNLASDDKALWRKSRDNLGEELHRAALIGAAGVVLHLGSVGPEGDVVAGRKRVAQALDDILARDKTGLDLILEHSASHKQVVGARMEDVGEIIATAEHSDRLRVCIDTAHAFAHGYPIHTAEGLAETLDTMDRCFGLDRIALFHANDSRHEFGLGLDRHWHIGQGFIGTTGFRVIMNEPRLRHLPFIMETPEPEVWDPRNMLAIRRVIDSEYRPPLRRVPARYR